MHADAPAPLTVSEIFGALPSLETPRLVLRPLSRDDAADVFEYARDDEVSRTTTWEAHRTIEDTHRFLDSVLGGMERGEVAPWALELKADGHVVGTCGFGWWRPQHARAELGYALARRCWNLGLMTEAAAEAIRFGFEHMRLHRLEAQCLPDNIGSARVMEKNGMRCEGILRGSMFAKGAYRDRKIYAILRPEWDAARKRAALA